MIRLLPRKRYGPIGVDIGARSVKLVQVSSDLTKVETSHWELNAADTTTTREQQLAQAIKMARMSGNFRGNKAALCLSNDDLFLQNVRVAKGGDTDRLVVREAAERLPFPAAQAEIRYIETADVRQGDTVLREVIVMACKRPAIDRRLEAVEQAGLWPVALEVEPLALARSYARQLRRDDERQERALLVHIGYSRTAALIVQDAEILFIKYIDVGGRHLDEAVADHLSLQLSDATALRRHNGDRRADQQDPEITSSIARATRPIIERLAQELAKCIRYHSVTYRGSPLKRVTISGGEATTQLCEVLGARLNLKCELSSSLRGTTHQVSNDRHGHWDIAMGLALRDMN